MVVVNRRELLLGVFALSTFPKVALSDQSTMKHMMRSQLLGSNEAPIKIKEFFSLTCGHCANFHKNTLPKLCLLYTSPSPRDRTRSRMPSSA